MDRIITLTIRIVFLLFSRVSATHVCDPANLYKLRVVGSNLTVFHHQHNTIRHTRKRTKTAFDRELSSYFPHNTDKLGCSRNWSPEVGYKSYRASTMLHASDNVWMAAADTRAVIQLRAPETEGVNANMRG